MADRPQFTPAPWTAVTYRAAPPHYAVQSGDHVVAARIANRDDAQLISASIELYDAGCAAFDWLKVIAPGNPVTLQLGAALDKVRMH